MGVSVAFRSVYSQPTSTETEGTNFFVSANVLEEPCSNRQADGRLAMGIARSEKLTVSKLCSILSRVRRRRRSHVQASGQRKGD